MNRPAASVGVLVLPLLIATPGVSRPDESGESEPDPQARFEADGRATAARISHWVRDSAWLAQYGFFHRRETSNPIISLTREEFDNERDILDRFDVIPAIEIYRGVRGRILRLHKDSGSVCNAELFFNGLRARQRGAFVSIFFLDLLRPFEIDGLELYHAADAPVGDPDGCGALLIWSKARADGDSLDFSGIVFGRVTNGTGQPLRDCPVVLIPGDHETTTDATGRFIIVRVTPGRVTVRAGGDNDGVLDDIDVRAFARTETDIIRDACPP